LRLKTQIFPEHTGDHLRTRLDHSLEVAQIARHFARQLRLNEDLVDAIALAHDIGHTPFGHSGERALHRYLILREASIIKQSAGKIQPNFDGFKHNWHGLRVVDLLEKAYPDHDGLNLTRAVRIGVLLHTKLAYSDPIPPKWPADRCRCDLHDLDFDPQDARWNAFEVQVCALADEIAQLLHDFEDAVISEQFALEKVVKNRKDYPLIEMCLKQIEERARKSTCAPEAWRNLGKLDFSDGDQCSMLVARLRSQMIYLVTNEVLQRTERKLTEWERENLGRSEPNERVQAFDAFVENGGPFEHLVSLGDGEIATEFERLQKKIDREVTASERVSRMDGKAEYVISHILDVYLSKPKQVHQSVLDQYAKAKADNTNLRELPEKELAERNLGRDKAFVRAAVDYVAGMTDRFALREYDQLYSAYPRIAL
jgi:dGTPase